MLTQLRVKNFRLLRHVTIDLGGLTVFVGPNSSGKSTVLEVLDFLGRCSTDGLQDALQAHGGFDSVRTIGVREPVQIATRWKFDSGVGTNNRQTWRLEWTIDLDRVENGAVVVRRESLIDHAGEAPRSIVETTPDGRRVVRPETAAEPEQGHQPTVTVPTSLAFDAFRDETRYPGLGHLKYIASQLRVLGSLTAPPTWARPSGGSGSARDSLLLATDEHLGRQGLGLANALYNLWMNHGQLWSELERAFRAEFPFVRRIVFPPNPGSKISFAFEDERYPDRKVYASEMSDGMVAYLILLAAIMQPMQLAVLGLDEPDATIHPSALRRLLEVAQQAHDKRRLVIVTHSNALLDELREPAKQIRVVEGTPRGATIRRLDAKALAAWRQQYTLSDLRHMGHVDRPNVAYDPGSAADGARPVAEPPRAPSTGREAVPRKKPRRPKARASKG